MSKLYLSEFGSIGSPLFQGAQAVFQPPINDQAPLDFTSGAQQSGAFNPATKFVRIVADASCSFLFGDDPTATTDNARLAADVPEYFCVHPGHKISVIANS